MKCKTISFFMCLFMSITLMSKSNKIEIINAHVENKYISKEKVKRIKKVKKVVKKSKKDKELEYWSDVVGKKVTKVTKIDAKLSFYTDLECENGYGNVDCRGNKLTYGTIANNHYALDTNLYIPGYGNMIINDRGGEGLWGNNFDVFIPKKEGDTSKEYFEKINSMGVKTTRAYILEFGEER